MISLIILRNDDNIVGFDCSGHSGYAECGHDIVCSAISSLTLTACMGIKDVLKLNCKIKQDDAQGKLSIVLKNNNDPDIDKAQIVFETMLAGVNQIQKQYKKYIKVED